MFVCINSVNDRSLYFRFGNCMFLLTYTVIYMQDQMITKKLH